jgi:hypothetical protein
LSGVPPRPAGHEPTLIAAISRTAKPPSDARLSCHIFNQKGSVMTHICCPPCRLRFTPAAAAYIVACPECGEPPHEITGQSALGFRLLGPEDLPIDLPQAVAVSIPAPEPGTRP